MSAGRRTERRVGRPLLSYAPGTLEPLPVARLSSSGSTRNVSTGAASSLLRAPTRRCTHISVDPSAPTRPHPPNAGHATVGPAIADARTVERPTTATSFAPFSWWKFARALATICPRAYVYTGSIASPRGSTHRLHGHKVGHRSGHVRTATGSGHRVPARVRVRVPNPRIGRGIEADSRSQRGNPNRNRPAPTRARTGRSARLQPCAAVGRRTAL